MLPDWHYHNGKPTLGGQLRSSPEDFSVAEELGFTPNGEGEHVFLRIRKRDANTQWVAQQLAAFAEIPLRQIGYAGLKDRHAIAEQWFSVHLPGLRRDWSQCSNDYFEILETTRNQRKLKPGGLSGNRFSIVIRQLQGDTAQLQSRFESIRRHGVPNYFGEQRFGHDGANIDQAAAMFRKQIRVRDRHRRGLYLSAARSYLFNAVLSRRVAQGIWNRALAGDVLMLDGTHSVFVADSITADIERRIDEFDLHPSGPLWGEGELLSRDRVAGLERAVIEGYETLRDGLIHAGLRQERRSLRLRPLAMTLDKLSDNAVCLSFVLPAGSYATSVIREICHYEVAWGL